MELNDLKSGWQNASSSSRTEADLQKMTQIMHNPSLKKIRRKLIVESIGLIIFLFIYYDWFDGDKKPLIANVFLVGSLLLYILNDVIGFISLTKLVLGASLRQSIQNYLKRIKRLFIFSMITSALYSITLIVFFASVIDLTEKKKMIMGGIVIVMTLMIILSAKIWNGRIGKLKQQIKDFAVD